MPTYSPILLPPGPARELGLLPYDDCSQRATLPFMRLTKNDRSAIQDIGLRIDDDPGLKHSTAGLALDAALSESKLKFGFKKTFNTSIHQYVILARMKKARELLADTDQKLLSVARSVGYRHLSTFIEAFKKQHHCTPGQYRYQNNPNHW